MTEVLEAESELTRRLFAQLHDARNLRGTIKRDREYGSYAVHSYSIGKPWFEYESVGMESMSERRRLRVVERWFQNDGHSEARRRGVVKIAHEVIFKGSRHDADPVKRGRVASSKALSVFRIDQAPTDDCLVTTTKLCFLGSGAVYCTQVARRDTTDVCSEGVASDCADDARLFRLEQPLFEDDYRQGAITPTDVAILLTELGRFIEVERGLAALRAAVGAKA